MLGFLPDSTLMGPTCGYALPPELLITSWASAASTEGAAIIGRAAPSVRPVIGKLPPARVQLYPAMRNSTGQRMSFCDGVQPLAGDARLDIRPKPINPLRDPN